MTELTNAIDINASADRVWSILADLTQLGVYDPTVSAAELTSSESTGIGASRKVTMADGKHWFDEAVVAFEPGHALVFELTACNFPIARLRHSYSFTESGGRTHVTQVMTYTPKFGPLGKLLDTLVIRRDSDSGIKAFLAGLKVHAERSGEHSAAATAG